MPQFSSDSHRVNCTKLTTRVEVDSLEITISSILIIKSKNNITKDFARFRYRKELWTGYFNLKFSNDTFETTSPLPSPPPFISTTQYRFAGWEGRGREADKNLHENLLRVTRALLPFSFPTPRRNNCKPLPLNPYQKTKLSNVLPRTNPPDVASF